MTPEVVTFAITPILFVIGLVYPTFAEYDGNRRS